MKKLLLKCLLVTALWLGFSQAGMAQRIYVTVQPTAPVVVRPAAPRADYVWVEGDWVRSGRGYVYQKGYWIAPRNGMVWIPGHWIRERRGWYWERGHWRRA